MKDSVETWQQSLFCFQVHLQWLKILLDPIVKQPSVPKKLLRFNLDSHKIDQPHEPQRYFSDCATIFSVPTVKFFQKDDILIALLGRI